MNYGNFQIFFPFICLNTDFNDFDYAILLCKKIKSKLVDMLNLILTNLTLYDQHYVGVISDSPTGLSQIIVALAAMLLLIVDIPSEIIFY